MIISVTPDQLSAAGGYISRQWGDYGYRVEEIESATARVSLFHVVASDGSRFTVLADRYGNCRDADTHGTSGAGRVAVLADLISEMHAKAAANG